MQEVSNQYVANILRERAKALILAAEIFEGDTGAVVAEATIKNKLPKRHLSAEARRKIALGQKKRRQREQAEAKSLKEAGEMLKENNGLTGTGVADKVA